MAGFSSGLALNQARMVNPYQNVMYGAGGSGHTTAGVPVQAPQSSMPVGPFSPQQSSMPAPAHAATPFDSANSWEYNYTPEAQVRHSDFKKRNQEIDGPQGRGYYAMKDPGAKNLGAQQHFLEDFRHMMPQMNEEMSSELMQDTNRSMSDALRMSKRGASARGMLHSGIEAGQEGKIRSGAAQGLAKGKEAINTGLLNAENQMMQQTAKAGFNYQAQQQQMQDSIYQEALRSFGANAGLFGDLLGVGGMAAGMALAGSGNPMLAYGMATGGFQAGKALGTGVY